VIINHVDVVDLDIDLGVTSDELGATQMSIQLVKAISGVCVRKSEVTSSWTDG
jgi:hypothetical protein